MSWIRYMLVQKGLFIIIFKHYGWFTGLTCLGCCTAVLAYTSWSQFIINSPAVQGSQNFGSVPADIDSASASGQVSGFSVVHVGARYCLTLHNAPNSAAGSAMAYWILCNLSNHLLLRLHFKAARAQSHDDFQQTLVDRRVSPHSPCIRHCRQRSRSLRQYRSKLFSVKSIYCV